MLLGASWPSGWEQRLASQLSSKTWLGPMAALASAVSLAQDPMAILFEHHAVVVDQERHRLRISILGRITGSCSLGPAEALPGAVFRPLRRFNPANRTASPLRSTIYQEMHARPGFEPVAPQGLGRAGRASAGCSRCPDCRLTQWRL